MDCHRYGVSGDFQGGIDLIAYRRGVREGLREPWCYQCKRWKKMTPADLRRIVAKFTYPADHYVVMTTVEATAALRNVVRDQPNVDLWDAEDISARLKDHADLVEDFFGPHWRDAFCGPWPATGGPDLPREAPYLHWLIGREAEKQALLGAYDWVERTGKGGAVVLMGRTGSGRQALAKWVRGQVEERGGAVAALRFCDRGTLSLDAAAHIYWADLVVQAHGPRIVAAYPRSSKILGGGPWVSLAAQLLAIAGGDEVDLDGGDDPRSLFRLVRKAARRGPLLLAVEYLDRGEAPWIDLLRMLADEIVQDLPVLLLVTLDAPAPLDGLTKRRHTEPTRLAEELVKQVSAQAHYLDSVTAGEIAASLAPAAPEIGERLHHLSDGDPLIVQAVWEEWVEQGAVAQDEDSAWRIAPGRMGQRWVYGDVRDHARGLLADLLEGWDDPSPFSIGQAERILNCAAVEGEIFTAPAVAAVMGIEDDDLVDFFDDCLVGDEETNGVLVDEGFAYVDSQRSLCQYRFARPYLHHVWAKYPRDEAQRREWSGQLADQLERLYYPVDYLIAKTLFDLFEVAGMPDRAEAYRRRRGVPSDIEALRWHARLLIEATPDEDVFGTYRLFETGFELADRIAKERHDLWQEGYDFTVELRRRAELVNDRGYLARAYEYMAWHQHLGGFSDEALPMARQFVAISEDQGDSFGEARGLNLMGAVLFGLGDYAGSREAVERALAIDEAIYGPDHFNVATILNSLGTVLWKLGDYTEARAVHERALAVREAAFGLHHPYVANSLNSLGLVLNSLGDYAGTRAAYERALAIYEMTYGSTSSHVATCLSNLGAVLDNLGDYAGALPAQERALAIREAAFGLNHPNVAVSLDHLGHVLCALGDRTRARAMYERALAIWEAAYGSDHPDTAAVRKHLDSLDRED